MGSSWRVRLWDHHWVCCALYDSLLWTSLRMHRAPGCRHHGQLYQLAKLAVAASVDDRRIAYPGFLLCTSE